MSFHKPSNEEEEYMARQEAEKKKLLAEAHAKEILEDERRRLKELHYNHCPKCGLGLTEISFRGVRIDKCFHCNGLWFDSGEFEQAAGHEHDFVRALRKLFT